MNYSDIAKQLIYCEQEHGGCGVCAKSDEGCSASRLKIAAANAINDLIEKLSAKEKENA